MKIHLFKIKHLRNYPLLEELQNLVKLPLGERNRSQYGVPCRVEELKQQGKYWAMDFVKIRLDHGPGRAGIDQAMTEFELAQDEGFGEDAAMLWCPASNLCAIQYNMYGVRPHAILDYLRRINPSQVQTFEIEPVIDEEFSAKLRSKTIFTKFEVNVNLSQLSHHDKDCGVPLAEAIAAAGDDVQAETVTITFSAGRGKEGLARKAFQGALSWVKEKIALDQTKSEQEKKTIRAAKLTGKDSEETRSEVLDLVLHKVTAEANLTPGLGKRYPRDERFRALEYAFDSWSNYRIQHEKSPD